MERNYTIPLRKEILKVPPYKRSKKAVTGIVAFIARHMKQPDEDKIKIDRYLNLKVWEHGIKNPPTRVKVTAVKDDAGLVRVYLFGGKRDEIKTEKEEKQVREPIVVPPQQDLPSQEQKAVEAPAEVKAEEKAAPPKEAAPKKPRKAKKAEEK